MPSGYYPVSQPINGEPTSYYPPGKVTTITCPPVTCPPTTCDPTQPTQPIIPPSTTC